MTKLTTPAGTEIKLGPLSQDLLFLTRNLHALLRPEATDLREKLDLESGVIGVLSIIWMNPGMSQNDLAASVALKKSAVTKLVTSLEGRGLILRQKVSADRRMNALNLTEEGHLLITQIRDLTKIMHAKIFADIPENERDVFFSVLGRLVNSLGTPAP
ncbi:MAG: MarR family winged helix-turn-helix transcriptional regulator [Paracoccaceae bacterium]